MKDIKVLGSGCANCKTTLKLIEEAARARGVEVKLEKVEDMAAILGYDHGDRMGRTNVLEKFSPGLSALQGWFILMVLGANGGLTVVAFLDVINHPS
jgi:hypothetical protein